MLNLLEMERYIAATAKRADLKVAWNTEGKCMTDGETLFLPTFTSDTTLEEYKDVRHKVCHEVDHVLYSDFDALQKSGLSPQHSLLGGLWNVLEDHRIEYLGDMEYEGDRLNNNDVCANILHSITKKIRSGAIPEDAVNGIGPALVFSESIATDYHPSIHRVLPEAKRVLPEKAKALLAKMEKGNYADVLRNIRKIQDKVEGSQATLDLAKRIFKEVYEQDPEEEMKKAKAAAEAAAKGKGKGKGQGKEGKGKAPGEGDTKDGEGKGDPKDVEREETITVDYSDMLPDVHDATHPRHNIHLDYSKRPKDATYIPAKEQDFQVHNYNKHTAGSTRRGSGIRTALAHTSMGFAHKVRTILQVRDRDRYQYGQKKGRLNQSSLHRIVVDSPGYNERVFKRKIVTDVLNCAITLLVDQSGSMSSTKFDHAAAAAIMFNDVVGNVLHIPVEIVSFTDHGHTPSGNGPYRHMHVHRVFKDKLVSSESLINTFSQAADHGMSNNADGDAIMWVFDRLIVRPEKRKLLVVFSDGQPAGGGIGDIDAYTRQVVKSIQEESPVTIVGMGIMDRNVERIYKEHYTIRAADQLEPAILSLIEKKVK